MISIPVIIAGGAGTRLWPLSRTEKPKQFHNLSGENTLFAGTIDRLLPLGPEKIITVTSKKYEDLTQSQLEPFNTPYSILSEPRPRNTAAAILYAAVYLDALYPDSVMIVLPADHHINNNEEFISTLKTSIKEAEKGNLVTLGIKPAYPETGYGYIQSEGKDETVLPVKQFVEKPDTETAKKYVESGNYYWNSGIFIWKTSTIMEAFQKYLPGLIESFKPLINLKPDEIASDEPDIWKIKEEVFNNSESISIDYGILEKAENRVVVPSDFGWADLGSWKSIDDILNPDTEGNRSPDPEKAIFLNAENCSVFSENKQIAVVGLSNVVVVEAGNEILVIDKDATQDVKRVTEIIKEKTSP